MIVCPHCSHRLSLKTAKTGRFRPKCPGCEKPFLLIVPEDPDGVPEARAILDDTIFVPPRSGLLLGVDTGEPSGGKIPAHQAAGLEDTQIPGSLPNLELPRRPSGAQQVPAPRAVPQTGAAPMAAVAPPSPSAAPPQAAPPKSTRPDATPRPAPGRDITLKPKTVVRGYELERELGRGGMGSVYLARQLSLNRHVALKVMSNKWASDPVFVARFTREAYASAQLSHPNIVQIHDIGEANGTRFFSMEYVRGRSLADVVKTQGKLDSETAVKYVLQAARGLKHAHDRGMIHRDVKPDNLLLGEQGLVKVADLGLVKTPATERDDDRLDGGGPGGPAAPLEMTGARIALGTPAYMSPEQCRDAAAVDHRADIYSLGCTLYVLVTGRPPFDGTTAMELMSKHAYDPLVPPEQIVARVPREVSAVIQRMMAKDAGDRFQTMDEVIRTLEMWLGETHTGSFSPREEQITMMEKFVGQFNAAPAAVLRGRVLKGSVAAVAIAALLLTFFGRAAWALGLFGLVAQAALAYFVIDGVARRGFLFTRTRQFLMGLSWGDWGVGVAGLGLFALMLAMLGQFWIWAGFGAVGAALAFALRYGLDRRVERQRRPQIEGSERLMRRLRMQGLDEEEIAQFVAKYAGRDWEEFFEELFGYEVKLQTRAVLLRGGAAGVREKHAAWREPLVALMDRVETARRAAREQQLLLAVERANLLAAGVDPRAADNQAKAAAEAMVQAAGHVREAEAYRAMAATAATPVAPVNVRQAVVAQQPQAFEPPPARREVFGPLVNLFVGTHVRAALALVLLAGCATWVHQNGLLPGAAVQQQAVETRDLGALQDTAAEVLRRPTQPLALPGVPAPATEWVDGWNTGVAGLLLVASLFYRGNVMAVFALLGAAVAAVGHQFGLQAVEPFRADHIGLVLGSVLALLGFRLGR
ncbi:serine/threonine-protein kinase [Gemmata sp.]|uniref:serine/threonine-protein kinase n=1 Tax=Gemmata sp. TaxID=1914242 RepID=UPI003F6EC83B